MTQDEWQHAQRIVTAALLLPEGERQRLVDTSDLEEGLRRRISDLLGLLERTGPERTGPEGSRDGIVVERRPALDPGDAIDSGRFVIVRQIGRGGMGAVYLAHDTTLGTLVALKVLPSDEALIAEARRAAVCSGHPHVATVHNVLRTGVRGTPVGVLVMEYVPGTPASQLIDDGPIDLRRVLRWGQQVAGAIAHAHDRQVLHCDLKPANIIITPDDAAKVLDFGIARATFDGDGGGGPLLGTLPYMAPEQMAGQFSQAADIYGLGVTLYELITGQRPFAGDGAELRVRILMEPPPRVSASAPGAPAELDSVLARALAKNPDDRYRSARAFARDLQRMEELAGRSPSVPQPIARRVLIAAASLAGTLVAMIALGAYTTATYNLTLERGDFASDTVADWLEWGFRASVGPLVMLVAVLLALSVTRLAWRLLASLVPAARRLEARVGDAAGRLRRVVHLDDSAIAAAAALGVSLAALGIAVFSYRDFLPALATFAADGSVDRLALMAPDNVGLHNAYRRAFSVVVIICVAAWLPILRSTNVLSQVPRGLLVAGALTLGVALVLLHHPHRLLFSHVAGHGVEAVRWQDNHCYVLGQRGSDTLLLCPALPPPRHRIVRTGTQEIESLGTRESVFKEFYREAARNGATSN